MISFPALFLLIVANSAPVVVARVLGERFAAPIDAGLALNDARPLFGPHKTWRGLIAGIIAAALAGAILGLGVAVGAAFGALALTGDLFSSFCKRRLGYTSGRSAPLLDQLPEALMPMALTSAPLGLTGLQMLGTGLVFIVLDALFTRLRVQPHSHADA